MGPEIYGVKWRDFKLVLVAQRYETEAGLRLATPHVISLITDPREREPVSLPYLHTWTATHFNRILAEFQASLKHEPLTPAAAPLDHVPSADHPN